MPAQQVIVLSRQPDCYSARRFAEAAEQLELPLTMLDPHLLYLQVIGGQAQAWLSVPGFDPRACAVIPRLGSTATEYSLAALDMLARAGARCANCSASLWRMRNKFTALAELATAGLPVPDSAMLRTPNDARAAVEQLGGYPVVLKFIRGSQGVGVVYAPDETVVTSVLEALNLLQYDVLIQRYYAQAAHEDLRVFVLGGAPRWAVQRRSPHGRFRSNFHRGGKAEAAQLDTVTVELAQRAAGVFGLGLAGVDLIAGPQGWLVMEVNSSPGFETIERTHGADVAVEIIRYALTV